MAILRFDSASDIENLTYIDVDSGEGRVRIAPADVTNVLYRYRGIPFTYTLLDHVPRKRRFPYLSFPDISDYFATHVKALHFFTDRETGERVDFTSWEVLLWREIDEEYRDVFLMQELSEMWYTETKKLPYELVVLLATKKAQDYVKSYLTPEEIAGYNAMLEALPERRKKPSRGEWTVIRAKKGKVISKPL